MILKTVLRRCDYRWLAPLYFFFVFCAGLVLVFKATPMSGIDELYHFKRALQVSEGHFMAHPLSADHYGGQLDAHLLRYEAFFDDRRNHALVSSKAEAAALAALIDASPAARQPDEFGSTATYAPLSYLPAAAGLWTAHALHLGVAHSVLLGRLFGFVIWLAGLVLLIRVLPLGKLSVIALLSMPAAIGVAASYSADPITNLGCALFVAWCLRLACTPENGFSLKRKGGMILLAVGLGLLKVTCALVALVVVLVPGCLFSSRRQAWIFRSVTVLAAFGTAAWWNGHYPFVPGRYWGSGGDPTQSVPMILHHPLHHLSIILHNIVHQSWYWWNDAVARFGNGPSPLYYPMDGTASNLCFLSLFMLALSEAAPRRYSWVAFVLAGVAAAYVFEIVLAFKVAFAPPEALYVNGIQGRYMIVPLTLLILALVTLAPLRERLRYAFIPALLIWMAGSGVMIYRVAQAYQINWY